jgi:hypothetical protein
VDFYRYIQRVRDVPHQHPTQASRNPRSNSELTREGRELPQLMMHLGCAINEEPQERSDTRMVQSCLNSDGTRTLIKYDEKRLLNEFARYIAKKDQPISMTYCTDFARLVIRGCGQPLYKKFHHNKIISELKKIC